MYTKPCTAPTIAGCPAAATSRDHNDDDEHHHNHHHHYHLDHHHHHHNLVMRYCIAWSTPLSLKDNHSSAVK